MSASMIETIPPNQHLKLRYQDCYRKTISVRVFSTDEINVYAFDKGGIDLYSRGKAPKGLMNSEDRIIHLSRFEGPQEWYLIIENRGERDVSCTYDVMW
jgi:hypothetical protein